MEKGTTKLVAFDLDGTILAPSSQPAASAIAVLRQLVDRDVAIASISGRSIRRSLEPLTEYPDLIRRMHICGYNGAIGVGPAMDGRREILYAKRLPDDVFLELVDYIFERDLNLVYCYCEKVDQGLVEEYRYRWETEEVQVANWIGSGFACDGRLIERIRAGELGPPPKIMVLSEQDQRDRTITEVSKLFGNRIYAAWAVKGRLEIMHPGVDKGFALRALSETTGVSLHEIMAIGDSNNDLPMLRQAGIGVLMGNAEPEIRSSVADSDIVIAPSFAEDGFAQAVREYTNLPDA